MKLQGILLHIVEHNIEVDTTIPLVHQTCYCMNLSYDAVIKQNLDKLLAIGFIKLIKQATWLYPIVVVPKKNGKLWICIDFQKLNVTTKKDLYPLLFTNEVLDKVAGHEVYSFLDGFLGYHQIQITLDDY
jgi:hypothetical protein